MLYHGDDNIGKDIVGMVVIVGYFGAGRILVMTVARVVVCIGRINLLKCFVVAFVALVVMAMSIFGCGSSCLAQYQNHHHHLHTA